MTDQQHVMETDLAVWWMHRAESEVAKAAKKASEYGSQDLIDIGRDCAGLLGRKVTDAEAIEYAIWFYLRGKLARWTESLRRGEQVSDDTILDIGTYARMVQRVRDAGAWPADEQITPQHQMQSRDWPESELAERVVEDARPGMADSLEYLRDTAAESRDGEPEENPELFADSKSHFRDQGNPTTTNPPEGATRSQLVDWLRGELMDMLHGRLLAYGFRVYNASGELFNDNTRVKVRIQYSSEEYQVLAWRIRGDRDPAMLRIRITPRMLQTSPWMLAGIFETLVCGCLRYGGPGQTLEGSVGSARHGVSPQAVQR